MRGVRTVVAADDQEQIHRLGEHVAQGVLPLLGCTANRIKKAIRLPGSLRSVAILNRRHDSPLHFFRFPPHHRGLIGHANTTQMKIWIKTFAVSTAETLDEFRLVSSV